MTIVLTLFSILQQDLVSFIFIGSGVSHLVTGKIVDRMSLGKSFVLGNLSRGLYLMLASFSLEHEQLLLFLLLGGFGAV